MSDSLGGKIKSFVERIERVQEEIDGLNRDKSEIFSEARGFGLNSKVIRSLVKERRDPEGTREHSELLDLYRASMNGTGNATRARTRPALVPQDSPAAPLAVSGPDRVTGISAVEPPPTNVIAKGEAEKGPTELEMDDIPAKFVRTGELRA